VDLPEAERRFREARVARLATVRPDGAPHVVPVVFVLLHETVWLVVDEKPKRTHELQRLANIRDEPRVSLLVDGYDEDWAGLWWVRIDGRARIAEAGPELERCVELLTSRYPQERERQPTGPAIIVQVERWRYWPAA
jgi:PPOX class probable F420-dependent enzyme